MNEGTTKQVLITGGAGYVGQVILDNMPDNWKATVIDNVYGGNNNFQPSENIEFVKGDIRNESLMEKLIAKNDAVIHLAGIVGDSCPNNPKSAQKINVDATEKIAKFCNQVEKRLIFMSTCSVYGFNEKTCTEETELNPLNAYSDHKVLGENVIKYNSNNHLIFRLGTVYGWSPRMRFDLGINLFIEKSLWKEEMLNLLKKLKSEGKKIVAYGMSGRGNTLLNFWGVDTKIIDYGIDASSERYGRYVPGMHIPIIPPENALDNVDYALLLAWIFKGDIMKKEKKFIQNGGKFIIPMPEPHFEPEN